jgi:hypothetical protein
LSQVDGIAGSRGARKPRDRASGSKWIGSTLSTDVGYQRAGEAVRWVEEGECYAGGDGGAVIKSQNAAISDRRLAAAEGRVLNVEPGAKRFQLTAAAVSNVPLTPLPLFDRIHELVTPMIPYLFIS